jgi:hypothetical protein
VNKAVRYVCACSEPSEVVRRDFSNREIAIHAMIWERPLEKSFCHDLVTMFNISVDEYFYPAKNVEKNTARRQIDSSLDLLTDNELKIIQGTIDGILNSREDKK